MKWWGLPAKIWMGFFILLPFFWLAQLSFQTTAYSNAPQEIDLHQYMRALSAPFSNIIIDSLLISFLAALAVLLIAIPLAWTISRLPRRKRNLWLALFTIPLGLNFVVRIYAWFVLFRPEGLVTKALSEMGLNLTLVSSQIGVFVGLVYGYLPLVFLPLYSVFDKLNTSQIEAAQDLGANLLQRWWHVILPETRLGLMGCFLFVFVPMLGEYLIPKMIGGGLVATLGTQIESQFLGNGRPNWPFGAALSLCLLVAAAAILLVSYFLLSQQKAERRSLWSFDPSR